MMTNKCLYCYKPLMNGEIDFHKQCSRKIFNTETAPILPYSSNEMVKLARKIIKNSTAIPGVQPKLSLGFINNTLNKKNRERLTIVGALGGNYILKPENNNFPEMPENEHLSMKLAEIFGIKTAISSLIRLQTGELSYITKRMDRTENGDNLHLLDMFQILEAFDKYKSSMEKVGKAVLTHSQNTLFDAYRLFELTLFCFVTGNNDVHLKNFSMINYNEQWELAPAYDLLNVTLHLPKDKEELALTLNGKKRKFNADDFKYFAQELGLNKKQMNNVFERLTNILPTWKNLIEQSFLSKDNQKKYIDLINNRKKQLNY